MIIIILHEVSGKINNDRIDLMGVEGGQVEKIKDAMLAMVGYLKLIGFFHGFSLSASKELVKLSLLHLSSQLSSLFIVAS